MGAIFKRELNAYFTSPIGYVFIGLFFGFSGLFFYLFALSSGSTDLSYVFIAMFFVLMVFIPILTMRLMSEDNKQKTDQLILTSPVGLVKIVMGKFLAAYAIFAIGVLMLLVYGIVLSCFADVNWAIILGNTVGIALLGGVFISSGLMVSTLTENQMIAAIGSMAINICLLLMGTLASVIPVTFISDILTGLSVYSRYSEFTLGIFSLGNVLFFISVIFIFMFINVRILEKRRWA